MKDDFIEKIKLMSESELETISKDFSFYTPEERMLALEELERRNKLSDELIQTKEIMESENEGLQEFEPVKHKIALKDLFPQKNYLFTPLLIYLNTFVFIIMLFLGVNFFNPNVGSLLQWGGNIGFSTLNGQYWRLLSSIFIHSGIVHLFCNMFALLYIGTILEKTIGKGKFIFVYLVSGIMASVASIFIHSNILSVGASGAIFGLFGVLLSLLLFKEFTINDFSKKSLYSTVGFFVLYNIMYGFNNEGIDNAAHIGGFLSGFLIGFVYYYLMKDKLPKAFAYISIIVFFSAFSTLLLYNKGKDIKMYNNVMNEYAVNEEKAIQIYKEDLNNVPNEQIPLLKEKINKQGIVLWDTNICLIKRLQKNKYPQEVQNRLQIVFEYTKLRKKSYQILIQYFDNPTNELNLEYTNVLKQIEEKLNNLNGTQKNN